MNTVIYHLAPAWERAVPEAENPVYAPCTMVEMLARYPLGSETRPSLLMLWSTPSALPQALELLNYWGYTYAGAVVWRWQGYPLWELGLYAWKNQYPEPAEAWRELYEREPSPATRVPNAVYHALRRAYPNARRIDLLAPTPPEGWEPFTRDGWMAPKRASGRRARSRRS